MQTINRRISLLFRMGERFLNRQLAGSGVSSGTAFLLLELRDGGDRNPTALAVALGVDKAHVTRSLRSLQQTGYVVVIPGTSDGRTVTVSLTDQGRAAADLAEKAVRAWVAVICQRVNPADLATVNVVFDVFYANAREYLAFDPDH